MGAELQKVAEVCSNGTAQDLPLGRAAAASLCRGWKRRTCCRTVLALDLLSAAPGLSAGCRELWQLLECSKKSLMVFQCPGGLHESRFY